jgi:hypothetical protein
VLQNKKDFVRMENKFNARGTYVTQAIFLSPVEAAP